MIYEEIPIGDALLRTYVLSNYNEIDAERRRAFILICPGGAYRFCSNREAEAVAIRFNSLGYNCGVLFYSTNHDEYNAGNVYSTLFPKPQDELSIGQKVMAKMTAIDFDKKRVSLSIRALLQDNNDDAEEAAENEEAAEAEAE